MSRPATERVRSRRIDTAPGRQRATLLWLSLGLLLLTAAVYAPVRHYPFLNYDDQEYITENAHVTAGLTRAGFVWAWTGVHQAMWHPLTTLSHMLDCQLFGLNAGPHHLHSVALHILNTLLLLGVLVQMTALPWRSACVAALFALHPLHVESVAWLSERKDVLSTFFWLLTLWAYIAYVRRRGAPRYALMLAAYVAALLSKPMAVTIPLVLLLLDVWPLRRVSWGPEGLRAWGLEETTPLGTGPARRRSAHPPRPSGPQALKPSSPLPAPLPTLLLEKLPMVVLAGVCGVIAIFAQRHAGAAVSFESFSFAPRVGNATVSYATYLGKMLWPSRLAVFYPFEWPLPAWQIATAAVVLIGITAVVLLNARRRPYLLVGWLWYIVTLLPVSGLGQVGSQARADRFTYVPFIGIFIMAAWGLPDLLSRWRQRQVLCSVAAALALAACTILSARQLTFWRDSITLFEHALAVTRENYLPHFIIGSALQEQGRPDDAFPHLAASLRMNSAYDKTNYDMGLLLAARGDLEGAKPYYLTALRLNPAYTKCHVALGLVLAQQGDPAGAAQHYREAIRLDPDLPAAHNNLAITLENLGQGDAAIAEYAEGVRLEPQRAESHANLAAALANAGRLSEAIEQFRATVQLKPQLVQARHGLAMVYAQAGQTRAAVSELDALLRERPNFAPAQATLAGLLATAADPAIRNGPRAVQLAEEAVQRTERGDPEVLNSLAAAYAAVGRFSEATSVAEQGLALAEASGRGALAQVLTTRLALYRASEPVR